MRKPTGDEFEECTGHNISLAITKGQKFGWSEAMLVRLFEISFEEDEVYYCEVRQKPIRKGRLFNEFTDYVSIQEEMLTWQLNVPLEKIKSAFNVFVRKRMGNSIRKLIEANPWDGVRRLDDWLVYTLDPEDTPMYHTFSRRFALQCVNIWTNPGQVAKQMLVVEGVQDGYKTPFCKALAFNDNELFVGNLRNLGDERQVERKLIGKLICEFGELASIKTSQSVEVFKSVVGASVGNTDRKWEHETSFPRTVVFVGNTNEEEYLKDPTGNTRLYPVPCKLKTPKWLDDFAKDWFQICAEALIEVDKWRADKTYDAGRPYMNAEESAEWEEVRNDRMEDFGATEKLQIFLHNCREKIKKENFVFWLDIANGVWGDNMGKFMGRHLRKMMKDLGFISFRKTVDGVRLSGYSYHSVPEILVDEKDGVN